MEEALVAHLLANAGLTALVGTRVTWARRTRGGDLPAVVLHRVGGDRDYIMAGPSGLVLSRVQADCWGDTYAAAKASARAVVAVVSGLKLTAGGIQGAFVDSERDLTDDGSDAAERLFRVSIDFQIWHSE